MMATVGLILAATVLAGAEPQFALPLVRTAPAVDGCLGADEWRDAAEFQRFVTIRSDVVFPGKASFWVARDDRALYLAARCEVGPEGILRGVKARKGNTLCFSDDSFEFDFIDDATASSADVRHMILNANGAYNTFQQVGSTINAWTPEGLETASQVKDGWWTMELRLPFETIGFTAANAAKHALRFARNWKRVDTGFGYQTCFSAGDIAFGTVAGAARMAFDDAAPVVQLLELGMDGDLTDHYPVKLRLANNGSVAMDLDIRIEGRPVNSQPGLLVKRLTLAAGAEETLSMRGAVLGDENIDFSVSVKSADGARTYYSRRYVYRQNVPPVNWLKSGEGAGKPKVRFAHYPSHRKIRVEADFTPVEKRPKSFEATFAVESAAGKRLAERRESVGADGHADFIWDIPDLGAVTRKSGDGGYVFRMDAPAVTNGTFREEFRRDVFEWEGNRLGLSDAVPAPFEPVKREEGRGKREEVVEVVLRDHVVDKDTGLWKQVNAAGKDILARPMRLVAHPSSLIPHPSSLSTSSTWDVDGTMTWELTLKAGQRIDSLDLEIPLKAKYSKLLAACTDGCRFNYAGALPAGTGRVWDSTKAARTSIVNDFVPYIFVGGPVRGISVFGDNDRGWSVDEGKVPCQEIVRGADGAATIVLHLISKPIDIKADRVIKLGILATPVKPMVEGWRLVDPGHLFGACSCWGAASHASDINPWDGTDAFWRKMAEARRTGKFDEAYLQHWRDGYPGDRKAMNGGDRYALWNMSKLHGSDRKTVFYTNGQGVSFFTPEGRTFADEWYRHAFFPNHAFTFASRRDYDLDPVDSYLDFAAWWWRKMLDSGACDRLYWDCCFLQSSFNLVGTAAYVREDGEIQPSAYIFQMREQVKRAAVMMAELGSDNRFNWIHMTNAGMAPISAFGGIHYDWEDAADLTTFQERYTRECIQVATTGRAFGVIPVIMGYFSKTTPEKLKWLFRTGTGVCLTHELDWSRFSEPWRQIKKALVEWGYGKSEVEVYNYWDDETYPVAITGAETSSLAMCDRTKRRAIVIVSDWSGKDGRVTVRPDAAALGLPANFTARDFESGAELPVADGALGLDLGKYDFRVVEFR